MKKYTILFANKSVCYQGLERAKKYAQEQSLVSFRASVFDGNQKIVTYEWGKEK